MKNNQNITQQIQTSLKHLGFLFFLLLTVIVLINCSEEGGISGGGISGGSGDGDGGGGGGGGGTFTYNNPPVAVNSTQSIDITFSEDLSQASITASDFSVTCIGSGPNGDITVDSNLDPLVSPENSKKLHVYLVNYWVLASCTLRLIGEISSTAGNTVSGVVFDEIYLP